MTFTLRPYQLAADAAIIRELEEIDRRSTLLVEATGCGKTVSFLVQAQRYRSRGARVLILAHRDELIQQPRRKLEALGITPDIEKGKQRASLNARIVIASVQSMRGARLLRFARDHFALIIVDEAHHSMATGYRGILDHFADAKVLGVTATPDRADGEALGEVYESVAFRYEIRQAIRDRWLVPITARRVVVQSVDLANVATRAGDLAQDQLAAVLETVEAVRGVVDPLLELARDRTTIVFGVDVEHARLLADGLNDQRSGCAQFVSGETAADDRERIIAAHDAGEFQFLCNCDVLSEGYDSPRVSCVAIVAPTKSRGRYVQRAGRGTRLLGATLEESIAAGKADCLLLDFTGMAGRHKLVGPVDCLAGSDQGMDALADDLRAELDRLLGTQQLDLEVALAEASETAALRRAAMAADAIVTFYAEAIDPFVGPPPRVAGAVPQLDLGWASKPPTEAQLKALEERGVTISKLPPSFSQADAASLLIRLRQRRDAGLCTLAQAKAVAAAGIRETATMTFDRARALIVKLRTAGYHRPFVLWGEPEAKTPRSLEAIAGIRQRATEKRARARLGDTSVQRAMARLRGEDGADPPGFVADEDRAAWAAGIAADLDVDALAEHEALP